MGRARIHRSALLLILFLAFSVTLQLSTAPAPASAARDGRAAGAAGLQQNPSDTPAPTDTLPPPTATSAPPTETLVPPTPTRMATASPLPASATPTPAPPSATVPPATTEAASEQGLPNEERPILVIKHYEQHPGGPAAGQTFRLKLKIKNEGEHRAENARISLSSTAFLSVNEGTLQYENDIDEGDTETVEIDLQVASETKSGVHPLAVTLRWDDGYGGSYSDETTIGINVGAGAPQRPVLTVVSSRLPGRVVPGLPFDVVLEVLNSGGKEARNAVVAPAAGPLALQGGSGGPLNLAPGARGQLRMRMIASETGTPGATSQILELRYDSPDGERFTENHSVGLSIIGDAGIGPMPLITGYEAKTETVAGKGSTALNPGSRFTLLLNIQNVGRSDAVGTRLSIGGGSSPAGGAGAAGASLGAFAPLGTSNVRFLDRIPAGEGIEVEQPMIVDGGAKPGVYVLEMAFSYADADGVLQTSSEVVSLIVGREVRLDVALVEDPGALMAGGETRLIFDIINQGTETVNLANVRVSAEDGLSLPENVSEFVGALDAGGFYTLQASVIAEPVAVDEAEEDGAEEDGGAADEDAAEDANDASDPESADEDRDEAAASSEDSRRAAPAMPRPSGMAMEGGVVRPGMAGFGGGGPVVGTGRVLVSVDYIDDFQQQQTFEKVFELPISAAPEMPADFEMEPSASSGGSMLLRVIKGLLGLGASAPAPEPRGFGGPGGFGGDAGFEGARPVEVERSR